MHWDRLWRGDAETKSPQYFTALWSADKFQKPTRRIFILRSLEHDDRLFDRRIAISGNFPSVSVLHGRRQSERKGHNPRLCVTGLYELGRLRNIFAVNQLVFHLLVDSRFLDGRHSSAPVRSMFRISDSYFFYALSQQTLPSVYRSIDFIIAGSPDYDAAYGVFAQGTRLG